MRMSWIFDWRLGGTIAFTLCIFLLPLTGLGNPFNSAEHELFDFLAKAKRNAVGGDAPPVVQITFDQDTRTKYWSAKMPEKSFAEWPAVTPLVFAESAMNAARAGCLRIGPNRSCPAIIVVDFDIWPVGAPRAEQEIAGFSKFLSLWAQDGRLPLAVFIREPQLREKKLELAAATPWDAIVQGAPNLAWATGEGFTDDDGVARTFSYYTCSYSAASGHTMALPQAALFALAASRGQSPAMSKENVLDALRKQVQCGINPMGGGQPFDLRTGQSSIIHFPGRTGFIGYHLDDPARAGAAPMAAPQHDGSGSPVIQIVPGQIVFARDATLDFADGAIVVLSAVEPYFEDRHWTPYGSMPGALVLANAMRGLILEGPTHNLSPWSQYLILLIGVVAVHLFVGWVEEQHEHLLKRAHARRKIEKRRSSAMRVKGFIKELLYAATTRGGMKILAGIAILIMARLIGLVASPIGAWETIALVIFDTTVYMLLDDLDSAWRSRHVAHRH
jgi:hypothetical protein